MNYVYSDKKLSICWVLIRQLLTKRSISHALTPCSLLQRYLVGELPQAELNGFYGRCARSLGSRNIRGGKLRILRARKCQPGNNQHLEGTKSSRRVPWPGLSAAGSAGRFPQLPASPAASCLAFPRRRCTPPRCARPEFADGNSSGAGLRRPRRGLCCLQQNNTIPHISLTLITAGL